MITPGLDSMAGLALRVFPQGGQRGARRNARIALTAAQGQADATRAATAALEAMQQVGKGVPEFAVVHRGR